MLPCTWQPICNRKKPKLFNGQYTVETLLLWNTLPCQLLLSVRKALADGRSLFISPVPAVTLSISLSHSRRWGKLQGCNFILPWPYSMLTSQWNGIEVRSHVEFPSMSNVVPITPARWWFAGMVGVGSVGPLISNSFHLSTIYRFNKVFTRPQWTRNTANPSVETAYTSTIYQNDNKYFSIFTTVIISWIDN